MRKLYRMAELAAGGHSAHGLINVLILGETGAGKEVLAEWIHSHSPRARGALVCINCAALTETLLESELFGHEKGAFTGAVQAKPGLLETAAGGTVLLDEIGEMPAGLQTKLLRTLETRQVTRVGGLSPRPIDVRFIAATNRDLEAEVAAKVFRQDLFFRLNGMSLTIPPLRERPEEIEALARRFLADASAAAKRRTPRLSEEALAVLVAYAWPGNIRELRNVVERALVLCEDGAITTEHLPVEKMRASRLAPSGAAPPAAPSSSPSEPSGLTSEERGERDEIVAVMAANGGNQTRTAKKLGIARGTLIERLKRYGIKRPQSDD
jgi:transcriptional regulator with PAS, ATPase and Fis domain